VCVVCGVCACVWCVVCVCVCGVCVCVETRVGCRKSQSILQSQRRFTDPRGLQYKLLESSTPTQVGRGGPGRKSLWITERLTDPR